MKIKLSTVVMLIATTAVSYGYTTATDNLLTADPSETPVLDNTGSVIALGAGSVAVGYFGSFTDGEVTGASDFAALLADFQQFGTSSASGFQNLFNAAGFFSLSTDASIPEGGNAFTGNNVYTVIGDAATLAGSSFLAVWKGSAVFTQENAVGLGSVSTSVTPGSGSLLLGSDGGAINVGVGPTFTNSIQLAAAVVPEPSSMFLLGLVAIGFMARRKR